MDQVGVSIHERLCRTTRNSAFAFNDINLQKVFALQEAVRSNDVPMVRCMIDDAVYLNSRDDRGNSFLHDAALYGHLQTLQILIELCEPDVTNDAGKTPMHLAARRDHLEIIAYLAKNGADVNARDANGCTPLHEAVQIQSRAAIEVLLGENADPNLQNCKGRTPFDDCVAWTDVAMFNLFLRFDARLTEITCREIYAMMQVAVVYGDGERIARILQFDGVQVDGFDLGLVFEKCQLDESTLLRIARLMEAQGYPVVVAGDEKRQSLMLGTAVQRKFVQMTEFLLDRGVDPNLACPSPPIQRALEAADCEMARLLLSRGARIDFEADSRVSVLMLFLEAMTSTSAHHQPQTREETKPANVQLFDLLIAAGARVNVRGCELRSGRVQYEADETPLSRAIRCNVEWLPIRLLDHGADVADAAVRDSVRYGRAEMLKLLLTRGARLDPSVKWAEFAITCHQPDVLDYLLEIDCDDVDSDEKRFALLTLAIDTPPRVTYHDNEVAARSRRVIEVLVRRFAVFAGEKTRALVASHPWIAEYRQSCESQLDEMRHTRICGDVTVTYYDLLAAESNAALVRQLRCERGRRRVGRQGGQFWLYRRQLAARLARGKRLLRVVAETEDALLEENRTLTLDVARRIAEMHIANERYFQFW